MKWSPSELSNITNGRLISSSPNIILSGISTDSRQTKTGDCFVALAAERDGHDFIDTAVQTGASCLLVSKEIPPQNIPVILVQDTWVALGQWAHSIRQTFKHDVVGITGSNGKTSTKEMLGSILKQEKQALVTEGNFNNLLGLPLTLFRLQEEDQAIVLEMGMNAPGEIETLTKIATPTIGLITNVAAAHLEGLGDLDGVAQAKTELFRNLSSDATAVVFVDDPMIEKYSQNLDCKVVYATWDVQKKDALEKEGKTVFWASNHKRLGIHGEQCDVCWHPNQSITLQTPLLGFHQCSNAFLASVVAILMGISSHSIQEGLKAVRPTGRRMSYELTPSKVHLLDDCYNSNPSSCRAGLSTLKEMSKESPSIAVLGDMLEMGSESALWHRKIGQFAAELRIDSLLCFGNFSQDMQQGALSAGMPSSHVYCTDDIELLWKRLQTQMVPHSWVLIKGSRGMRLERMSERVKKEDLKERKG